MRGAVAAQARPPQMEAAFLIGGLQCVPDPSGALYLPAEQLLVVADLHLEKGSSFARRGVFLPPYDTMATLARLQAVIGRYAPRTVVALGDSFHDVHAPARLDARDREALRLLQTGRAWMWVAGNHDPEAPPDCGGEASASVRVGALTLCHKPGQADGHEIAGHLHPVARVLGMTGSVRRRSFVADDLRCVMPAFGAYAGGLNLHDEAFDGLFDAAAAVTAFALGRDRVYAVPRWRCLPD